MGGARQLFTYTYVLALWSECTSGCRSDSGFQIPHLTARKTQTWIFRDVYSGSTDVEHSYPFPRENSQMEGNFVGRFVRR